jgi:hypothetical protein
MLGPPRFLLNGILAPVRGDCGFQRAQHVVTVLFTRGTRHQHHIDAGSRLDFSSAMNFVLCVQRVDFVQHSQYRGLSTKWPPYPPAQPDDGFIIADRIARRHQSGATTPNNVRRTKEQIAKALTVTAPQSGPNVRNHKFRTRQRPMTHPNSGIRHGKDNRYLSDVHSMSRLQKR